MSNYCLDCGVEIPDPFLTMDDEGNLTTVISLHNPHMTEYKVGAALPGVGQGGEA